MENASSSPRYPKDYELAQLLIGGEDKAWEIFYRYFRQHIVQYIEKRYPRLFTDIQVEEICDGVQERLMANNYRVLRQYRGELSFGRYLTRAVEWELRDWLRRHVRSRFIELHYAHRPSISGLSDKPLPLHDITTEEIPILHPYLSHDVEESTEEIPDLINKTLSDELRWAFLLRYYYFFGFPEQEIRLLVQKQGLSLARSRKRL